MDLRSNRMGLEVPCGIPCGTCLHVPVIGAFYVHSVYLQAYGGAAVVLMVIEGEFVIDIKMEVGTNGNLQILDLTFLTH